MKVFNALNGLVAAAAFVLIALAAPAHAQATRTWVSGVGDDANPCSRTAPCKTFPGAISKTAAGGEISVLDPGGFGGVTITKAISIVADGVEGGVLVGGTSGITINAGPTDNVSIRGLTINGAGSSAASLSGIKVIQANNVYISNTAIFGFQAPGSGYGIDVESSANGPRVYLKNVEIYGNSIGIYLHSGSVTTGVVADACTISGNTTNSALADTSTSVLRAQGSSFASSPVTITNGAQFVSNGNNFFAFGSSPPTQSPLQ